MAGLAAEGITKTYDSPGGELSVLRGASLHLGPGGNAAILGPSGSGKSTLLAILGTLERPTAGTLTIDGVDPFAMSDAEVARFRNRGVGFIFQDHHLLPQCTVLQNVLVPLLVDGAAEGEDAAYAERLLEQVGLADRAQHRPAQLSGGERQRVAIARALIRRPTLLLADEPTGNLDAHTAGVVTELLLGLHSELRNVLVTVTHSERLASAMQQSYTLTSGVLR